MANDQERVPITEEKLVAYLDKTLPAQEQREIEDRLATDPDLVAQLAALDGAMPRLARAADELRALAPVDHLNARLDAALAGTAAAGEAPSFAETPSMERMARGTDPAPRDARRDVPPRRSRPLSRKRVRRTRPEWWALAASVVVAFAAGASIHALIDPAPTDPAAPPVAQGPQPAPTPSDPVPAAPKKRGWKKAIADYAVLYRRNSLAPGLPTPDEVQRGLSHVETGLGLPLPVAALETPGFDLVNAELLYFNDKPLAKITYRDAAGVPVLFCIIRSAASAETKDPALGAIDGLKTVAWDKAGFGYVVIGDTTQESLTALARNLLRSYF